MNKIFSFVALALLPLAASCGTDAPGFGEDDLTQAGKKLIGEYVEKGEGPFRGLVLTSEAATSKANIFFADIDTGIVCVRAPCPTVERIEGTFTAGTKYITLKSATASDLVVPFLGKYSYKVVGDKFSLSRTGLEQSLEAVDSYCAADSAEDDCSITASDLVVPACVGVWSCSSDNACDWNCDGGGIEGKCGGFAGLTCSDDEFCDYEDDQFCGAGDQMGTCKPRPTSCPVGCPAPQYRPCACNGKTYCNDCSAHKAGVDVSGETGTCN